MKKILLLIFILFAFVGNVFAWTQDTLICGPGDGANGGDPADDDLSTTGQNNLDTWKAFRWQAGASGDAYIFAVRMVGIAGSSKSADCQYAIYTDNAGECGDLKLWGYETSHTFNQNTREYFDLDTVVISRTITENSYYWLAWRSSLGNDGSAYFERVGSDTIPAFVVKRGDQDAGYDGDMSQTPPAGAVMTIPYSDEYYGWTVWTASDADPSVSSTSGTWAHGESVTINGNSFGDKNPAAPLIWDDCEGKTVNNDAAVTTSGWSDPWPRTDGSPATSRTRYRAIPYRSTTAPHSNSSVYLAGCHYQESDNDPQYVGDTGAGHGKYKNVGVTVDNGSGSTSWYVSFYYTLDPAWNTANLTYNNHKTSVAQAAADMYGTGMQYIACCGSNGPAPQAGTDTMTFEGHGSVNELGTCGVPPPYANNPIDQWIKYEETVDPSDSNRHVYVDNTHVMQQTPSTTFRSFSIGGYYRRCPGCPNLDDVSDFRGGVLDSNYRYFDDMYIDTTMSRVMLANNQTYDNATIIEPQIPTVWNANGQSITITVNQGALPDGTAYLFVFDSDNDANDTAGYEVTLGEGETDITIQGMTINMDIQ